ncbi:uncharacterized protein N0V89_005705 [Didymosphaeria variabile]|uniref:Uncharacterized protein n=1 Tax=Didymosphaeria variabile TaxID=1932322 RepID=A0A9W8XNE4_9PLEO|nr:uncharacterized protein N0V89_005705 [Didymosphaeria variabile]KAJ4353973.1 hypothetical protein N0V89_005705 [Didymosphaeria variabile]
MVEKLRIRVERLDPEQWRKHENPPVLPEPGPIHKVLPGLNKIIKEEASYQNDPVLHEVSDQCLPIMWAFRNAPKVGVHLVSPEGEVYDPDHPVWAESKQLDADERDG